MARGKKKETLTPEERLQAALVPEIEQLYKIPENWCWVKLSSLSQVISKGTTPKGGKSAYSDHGVKFLRVENINDDGTISHENIAYVSEELHCTFLKRSILEENDILISIAGTLGKTGIVRSVDLPINTNQAVAFVRIALGKIDRRYIKNAIDNPVIQNLLLGKTKVTSIPNLTLEIIGECPIPLPPFAEQQRIVDCIESLFAKLDEAKQKAQDALDSFETRKAAILHKAFTGELTAQWRKDHDVGMESWEEKTLQAVCSMKITDGTHKTPTYCDKGDGIPFISAKDVTTGKICWDNIKYITPDLHEELYARLAPQIDDILLAKNGTTGIAAIVETDRIFDLYVTLAVLRPDKKIIMPRYLLNIVNSPICKNQFNDNLTGIGVPNLHLRDIKAVVIKVPSIPEQAEIVHILDDLLTKEQQAKEAAEKVLDQIDLIKKSILARAFRGELGTNDPNEESVIEFLKVVLQ